MAAVMTKRRRRDAGPDPSIAKAKPRRDGRAPPRLFVDAALREGGMRVRVREEARHYLMNVLRREAGDTVRLFNGRDGEWRARVETAGRRELVLVTEAPMRTQGEDPVLDLWLAFAPVKRSANEWIVEKATELGVSRILPVLVRRGETRRINMARWRTIAREAAEQCERLSVPEIAEPVALDRLLAEWPRGRPLFAARERSDAPHLGGRLVRAGPSIDRAGLLVGPEGGFTADEHARLAAADGESGVVRAVSLGARILRAETAVLAGLALIAARLDCAGRACEEDAGRACGPTTKETMKTAGPAGPAGPDRG